MILNRFFNSFIFWAAWIFIPVIMEIIPALGGFVVLLKVRRRRKTTPTLPPALYPEISVIIPVYNSADTLEACLRSFNDCTYPNKAIRIFLVNNLTRDNSFEIFTRCQALFPDLHMQWLNAQQGKSRALNLALYNSGGKYIIHIDSDGLLEPHALTNLVNLFESDLTCNCVTGSILTDPKKVEEYKGPGLLLRRLEFMEYANAFLAGRNYAGETNSIYTVSGAFSAFRKSAILKSWLYNTDTICEDTQLTFQMRYIQGEKIRISVDSIFLTDPIEDLDKLYTQRQRWQRGSLEVSKMFMNTDKLNPAKIFTDVNVRTLMYDHTFAFPRMIWYLATICMLFLGFSGKTILLATGVLFGLYTVCGFLNYFASCFFLKPFDELHDYYKKNWWVVPLLPFFNLMVFFIRLAGIVNSIGTDSSWKTRTFTDERQSFRDTVKEDFSKLAGWLKRTRDKVNGNEAEMYAPKTLEQKLKGSALGYVLTALVFLLAVALAAVVHWADQSFNLTFNEILNAPFGPLRGAGGDILAKALWACLPPVLAAALAAGALIFFERRHTKKLLAAPPGEGRDRKARRTVALRRLGAGLSALALCGSLVYANARYDAVGFVRSGFVNSSIYEMYYIDPQSVAITAPEKPKNLIYIYLEGMEIAYADAASGGVQQENLIPNLTRLAQENVSFSQRADRLGGFFSNYGSTWTMAALCSTTSGVHYDPIVGEQAAALTTLGDVLAQNGYQNEFLCGSDAQAGGYEAFFLQHGDYAIFDYDAAREKGYIPEDYYAWRGLEDKYLFQIAKDEITRLYKTGQPFNLTLLTADTGAPDGYRCSLCGDDHGSPAADVVACSDAQVGAFIAWCESQPFFENTLIVITGDHPRMDRALVGELPEADRRVYNCFINAQGEQSAVQTGRECNALDLFPTVLSALGFDIPGNALGLGTDLFSTRRTLSEGLGTDTVERELGVHSNFYASRFAS